jgi:FKBP-type peptidyl-prolyl cis-trans isomerase (trigger factor)
MAFTITKHQDLPDNEYQIDGEIHADIVTSFKEQAVKELGMTIKVDGFRPGHIPEKVIIDKFGELALTEEAGRIALEKHYGDILEKAIAKAKIKPLGSPAVTITKVAPGEAFGFSLKVALMPEVKIKDYKKVAKKVMSEKAEVTVSEKEIEDAINDLQQQVAHADYHKAHPEDHSHDHGGHGKDLPLPEVDLEFTKKFGNFETIEAFKDKVKEGLTIDKSRKEKEKKRLKLMDELIASAEVKMPKMLIESELSRMVHEMSANIQQMGLTIESYLKHIGKDIDALKKEWLPDAEKRAKTQLILNQVALEEKITASEEEINKEVEQIMQHYKDIDKTRAQMYVENVLLNEKVWQWLEEVIEA